jgi:pimeloyl-ACP methyl ester carboxylesterase
MGNRARRLGLVSVVATLLLTAASAAERWESLPDAPPMPPPVVSGYAPVNGIKMYYAIYGQGEPILLIHGGLANSDYWANQVLALSKTHKVIVADSRGHGRSTRTAESMSYDLMASDYAALLDYLKIQKTALVGTSDGGIIGIDLAMTRPERLTKLFAHAALVTTGGEKPDAMQSPAFSSYDAKTREDYKRLSSTPGDYAAFLGEIEKMYETQPNWTKEQLSKISVPVAIVLGDHDEVIKREHADYMASVIPGAKLIILKDVSHFAMLQDPEGYTKAIRDFLEE